MSFVVLFFLVTSTWIGVSVRDKCELARAQYDDEYRTGQAWRASEAESTEVWRARCSEALVEVMRDEGNSFKERNDAVWALGQLGDEQALGSVEAFYTGNIPDREPYNQTLSQYEMKKAINLLSGGWNATAWLWR